jgi:flagellar basal body-associated protein FliL
MDAFLFYVLSIILIDMCSARVLSSYSNSSSSSSSTTTIIAIVIPVVAGMFVLCIAIFCFVKQCGKRQRMGVMPLSTRMALAQQEYQYTPPGFKQPPPYGQPPPYEQPPPYSAPSAPMEPTTMSV